MKILHTADLHLGKTLNGYSLIDDQKEILNKIKDIIKAENVSVVIIAGDIFDRAITTQESLNLFTNFIEYIHDKGKHLVAILGNHDSERIAFASSILKNSNIHIVSEPRRIDIEDVKFFCIPYYDIHHFNAYYNEEFESLEDAYKFAIDDFNIKQENYNILIAHDYFTYNMEELIKTDSEVRHTVGGLNYLDVKLFEGFDYVALGHMHSAQKVMKDTIRYSGSVLKYSFSEVKDNKSVVIIDTDNDSFYKVPLIPTKDLVEIKGDLKTLISSEFYSKYNYKNDYFRAIIPRNEVNAYSELKAIYPNIMEITTESEDETKERVLERQIVKENNYLELFKMFYKEATSNDLSDDELKIIKDYLGGIK